MTKTTKKPTPTKSKTGSAATKKKALKMLEADDLMEIVGGGGCAGRTGY